MLKITGQYFLCFVLFIRCNQSVSINDKFASNKISLFWGLTEYSFYLYVSLLNVLNREAR